jgi:hypothetical protein
MKKLSLLSCLCLPALFLVTFAPPSQAVVVLEYSELFHALLENLRTHYWSEDGDWIGDMQYDAGAFAPQILYRYGWESGDQDLIDKANRTVDRNIDLFMEVLEGNTSNLTEALIGAVSIPDAIRYYSGAKYADLPMEEMVWAGLREGKKIIREDPNPMGEYVGYLFPYGALSYAGFYYASIAKGIWGITAVPEALDVLRMANQRFWYREMIGEELASYYYDSSPYHWRQRMEAYGNGAILSALAKAYGVTLKREHRDRATALLDTFDAHLWDRNRGGYGADLDNVDWKALSINTVFLRAILDLYDVTGRPALLIRAREILEFIERDLLIEDPDHPGFVLCAHDWVPFRGPSRYICTGCNFALLEGIFRLNELVQNGPTHPFPILVCGALPGEERSTFQAAIYTVLLFLPGLWILLRRRRSLS